MNPVERQRLQRDHRHLDEEIKRIMGRPHVDPITVQQLKKRKLAIKDQLHRVATIQTQAENAA